MTWTQWKSVLLAPTVPFRRHLVFWSLWFSSQFCSRNFIGKWHLIPTGILSSLGSLEQNTSLQHEGMVWTQTTRSPVEKSVFWGSGRSMVASLKRSAIDGRGRPGVEPAAFFDSSRENWPGPEAARIQRVVALSSFSVGAWPFVVDGVLRRVHPVNDRVFSRLNRVKYDCSFTASWTVLEYLRIIFLCSVFLFTFEVTVSHFPTCVVLQLLVFTRVCPVCFGVFFRSTSSLDDVIFKDESRFSAFCSGHLHDTQLLIGDVEKPTCNWIQACCKNFPCRDTASTRCLIEGEITV